MEDRHEAEKIMPGAKSRCCRASVVLKNKSHPVCSGCREEICARCDIIREPEGNHLPVFAKRAVAGR